MNVTASKKALYCRTEYIFIFITCIVQVEFSDREALPVHHCQSKSLLVKHGGNAITFIYSKCSRKQIIQYTTYAIFKQTFQFRV